MDELKVDPEFLAELERRTTILPDGRKIINLENIMARYVPPDVDAGELISELLAEVRRDRDAHFDKEWPEIFPAADKE